MKPLLKRACATLRLALCVLILFSAARQALAQSDDDFPQQQQEEGQTRPPRGGDGAGLLRRLNLTPEQVGRIREIRQQSEPEGRALVRRVNQARRALNEAIYSGQADERIVGERARELAEAQAAATRMRAQVEWSIRRVLTDEQLGRLREMRQQAQRTRRMERRRDRQTPRTSPTDAFAQPPNAPGDANNLPKPRRPLRRRGVGFPNP
ncbi:MAG TPA: Spy/CpxP family protein refolding chaperone [Pyrinomonadaceae bacterium]